MKKFTLAKEPLLVRPEDFSIPYGELLNPQQYKAVFHQDGPALVIAGAGTGKTRTLIHRVARLIESGVDPTQILLLTFTRRAATEMLERASKVLDDRCKQVKGGTFHFYCSQILHRYAEYIGFPNNFTIIDTADALEVIQFVRTGFKLGRKIRFPNKNTLLSMISTSINKDIDLSVVVMEQFPQFAEIVEAIEKIAEDYADYKEKNFVMDFDDLLIKTKQLLEQHKDISTIVSNQHKFIMVDEYQDTNKLQAELIELFSKVHRNVMAVGDDAQSIYSFRGADHQNIMDFPKRFENTVLIKLEENYRSTPQILDVANGVLGQANFKFNKELYTSREDGELVALVQAQSEHDQSRFISQVVLNQREEGVALNDLAVLFRSGRDSYDLEIELKRKNIPFVKYGGQKFTEAAHVKDVLAHIRVLVNPMDIIAWNRVLMLIEGVGPKTAQDMFEWIKLSKNPYQLDLTDTVNKAYVSQMKELSMLLVELKEEVSTVSQIVSKVVEYYRVFCQKRYDDYPKRIKDLEAFINISANFSTLEKMLEELALDPITATVVDTESKLKDEAPIVLSTIHSAKGLEWDQVFLIQCLDGIIPSAYSVDDIDKIDEELRLFYVATTRAKNMLYYCYPTIAQSSYGDYFTQPSRFISEIENNILEGWVLEEERTLSLSEENIGKELGA
tara:strand:- start:5749 stop:7767 length:2019 start_codon:yes stop_codon:yes gene_type:complete